MIRNLGKVIMTLMFFLTLSSLYAQKPKVWIISDGSDKDIKHPKTGKKIGDSDDLSAIAAYLLMSNEFDTRGIVVASTQDFKGIKTPNQAKWAKDYFGNAYKKDLKKLNESIGGYQSSINFIESSIKDSAEKFDNTKSYKSLKNYSSVKKLLDEIEKSKYILNVLCWGQLTEPAILVKHCISNNKTELLKKVRFISHWTNSNLHNTNNTSEGVHNCFNDIEACNYVKNLALANDIVFYECGAIGQYGIVEGSPRDKKYYDKFKSSALGNLFIDGKYVSRKQYVDDSDAATFWVLLGEYGVKLKDINSNGTNPLKVEKRNEAQFFKNAKKIREKLLTRVKMKEVISSGNLFPEKGLTDPHCLIENGRLYLFCGHDKSWKTEDNWLMDRWEIWSTTDLKDWKYESKILPTQTYIGDRANCWAGDIMKHKEKYYWYFSNRNKSTGVMVSDKVTGPYKDALGKPLLPEGLTKTRSYDPEIFQENNQNYIIFGAGFYYIAALNDDGISLKNDPQPIVVKDRNNKIVRTKDKPTLFKRNDWYYLIWGPNYAMSKKLHGPYEYKGNFIKGGHNCVFKWKDGNWYTIQERSDVSRFYRAVKLNPIFFNKDATIIPKSTAIESHIGTNWTFDISAQGWHEIRGTSFVHENGKIKGEVYGKASIQNAMWSGGIQMKDKKHVIKIRLKNNTKATKAKFYIASYDPKRNDFLDSEIEWSKTAQFTFDIKPKDTEFTEYTVDISNYNNFKKRLKRIRLDLAVGEINGDWEIDSIVIEKK